MKNLLLIFFSFFNITLLFGQSKAYRNYNYKWPDEKMVRMEVAPQYLTEPSVILNEKTLLILSL